MFDSREFEFADVKVQLFGIELSGLRGLTYKESQEKEPVYGSGNKPKAIQRGNVKYEGSLMLLKSDKDALNRAAVAAGYRSIIAVPETAINITCVYQKEGSAMLSTAKILGVAFTEYEDGMKQNDKFREVTLPFLCLDIIEA